MSRLLKNKFFKFLFLAVCAVLILFWILASTLLINKVSFSVMTFDTHNQVGNKDQVFKLTQGNNYRGTFKAEDNNLGLVIVQLEPRHLAKSSENLTFKLREEGSKKWDFQQSYSINLFDSQPSFSFGIPVVPNSSNKSFTFELSLKNIRSDNYLLIKNPNNFVTGYKYSKEQITGSKLSLIRFTYNKILGSFSDVDFVFHSSIYLFPLIAFLIFVLILKNAKPIEIKKIKVKKVKFVGHYLKYLILIFVTAELLFPQILLLPRSYIVIIIWFAALFFIKFKSSTSFKISFALIVVWIVLIPFGLLNLQENLNVLVYFSFATGIVQLLVEEKKKK